MPARFPDKAAAPPHAAPSRHYDEMRDFARTPEPKGGRAPAPKGRKRPAKTSGPIFVVQKHDASRLHWDFRLEHDGALWSWAVPKGPSLDPAHKRLAMHVEDHPLDYANFSGTIPQGNYGAGTVEIWDRGTWSAVEPDPAAALRRGELKFRLDGGRLRGGFVLVRLKPRPREKSESWLLIKEHDAEEREGADAAVMEAAAPDAARVGKPRSRTGKPSLPGSALPDDQAPQLARLVNEPPRGSGWISEVKFDGYRMICRKDGLAVRIITRNGLDWTERVPALAKAVAALPPARLMLDGELMALDPSGLSSFSRLQDALSTGRTAFLRYFCFDLLHQDGVDLRPQPLRKRREALEALLTANDDDRIIRFSEHLESDAARVRKEACAIGLEGIVCKKLDAPYSAGRGDDWVKVKCDNRDEFVVLGHTPPAGTRKELGALQLGFFDAKKRLHFAGGCGTGFSGRTLSMLRARLDALAAASPAHLLGIEKPPRDTIWVRPELVAEVGFAGFTGGGMLRQARFLGLREDKPGNEVMREPPPAEAPRVELIRGTARTRSAAGDAAEPEKVRIVVARRTERGAAEVGGQRISHADRPLWPAHGDMPALTKRDLAEYWNAIGARVANGIVGRPLALVRCPDGIEGEQFFQKHLGRSMPDGLREAEADGAPFIAVDEPSGLVSAAQVATIELHSWGSTAAEPLHADRLVFDLDPGPGVDMATLARAAREVRQRLDALHLAAFCRTSGGKGLHVVAPVRTDAHWDEVRAWCRAFAEAMEADAPDRFVSTTRKSERENRILVDWLRNGLGSTAVASFSPRARPGAPVATPLDWREVTARLDPAAFTIRTIPARLKRKTDPWAAFDAARLALPSLREMKRRKG